MNKRLPKGERASKGDDRRIKKDRPQPQTTVNLAANPEPLTAQSVLRLQRTIGNSAVQRLLSKRTDAPVQRYGFGDLWDDVTAVAGAAWDLITGDAGGGEKKKQSDIQSLEVPAGSFTITDAQAIIRRPPPALTSEKGKPLIPKGAQVVIVAGARKQGKDYVQVQGALSADSQSPGSDLAWTSAGNIAGLPAKLISMNPKPEAPAEDVVVPKPGNKGIPGLPEQPQLDHPEFSAIVQEMEQMEQDPLAVEKKHREETGDERTERVEKIAALRQRIAALGEAIPGAEADQIKDAQAYLYRRLAPLLPYYGQMANTNMLAKGSKGWDRTCNVTVPAMVVEGIGKTKADYDQTKLPLFRRIFDALEGKYKTRKKYEAVTDFDALRLPDFMAVIGIARWMPADISSLTEEAFVDAVAQARKTAAQKTTAHETMMYLIEQFGGKHKKYNVHTKDLDTIGTAQKAYTKALLRGQDPEKWRDLYNDVEAGKKSYDDLSDRDQKRYQTLWKYEQFTKEQADALLPVDTYRKAVLKKVNPLLDKGSQILVGLENHFVRLDALDQDAVQVDDPGEKGFKNLRVTWEQARNMGYFKGFWEIRR